MNTDADIYAGSNADKTLSLLLSLSSPHLLSFPHRVVSLVSRKFAASRDDRKKRKKKRNDSARTFPRLFLRLSQVGGARTRERLR